jgi:YggT family protein
MIVLILRLVVDWIRHFAREWTPKGLVLVLAEGIYTITDPPLRFIRRFIKPLRFGGAQIDLAFMLLFFVVIIAQGVLSRF